MKRFSVTLLALLSVTILLSAGNADAASHFVRSGATGSGTGSDWANACTGFTGSCAVSSLVRGDTYYVAGGSYAGQTFNRAASGTLVIAILGATVANHGTDTGWSPTYSVETTQATWTSSVKFSTSYWVFDGAVGPTWSQTPSQYGFSFGTTQYALYIFNQSAAITNFTISHIAASAPGSDVEKIFLSTDNSTNAVSNVTISHNYINGFGNAYWATSPGPTNANWTFEYNVCLNLASTAAHHGEWINNNYAPMTNRITRFNLFKNGGNGATGVVVANNNDTDGDLIYGNVVAGMSVSNGVFTGTSAGNLNNARIYNNVVMSTAVASGSWLGSYAGPGAIVENNLLYNMTAAPGSLGGTRDYNYYVSTTNTPTETHIKTASGNPFVNSAADDYRLLAPTTGGIALASPFDRDMYGNTRGADGVWDRGAIEFTGGIVAGPSAPSNLRIQ